MSFSRARHFFQQLAKKETVAGVMAIKDAVYRKSSFDNFQKLSKLDGTAIWCYASGILLMAALYRFSASLQLITFQMLDKYSGRRF